MRPLNLARLVCLLVILGALAVHFQETTRPNPNPNPGPTPTTSADMLLKYDANNKAKLPDKGAMIDSTTFRQWLEAHHVNYRIVPSTTTFNDDQPVFQKLDSQERKSDNWLYFDNGGFRGSFSKPLPASEDEAKTLIGRYVK